MGRKRGRRGKEDLKGQVRVEGRREGEGEKEEKQRVRNEKNNILHVADVTTL